MYYKYLLEGNPKNSNRDITTHKNFKTPEFLKTSKMLKLYN